MTDYVNGENSLLRRPEPGRPVHNITEKTKEINIDTNAIADAVLKAIMNKMPSSGVGNSVIRQEDTFDNSESLRRLADAMSINNHKGSNVEGIGVTKEVKKDKKEVDDAINLLSQLGD
jgi:hypothetical protein